MPDRRKTERNRKILELADKNWRQESIARMYKMKVSTVGMVIYRERKRNENQR